MTLGSIRSPFQRRLEGAGERVDDSTASLQQIVRSAANPDSRIIAQVIPHAIAGHHAGLPDTIADHSSLDARLAPRARAWIETQFLDPAEHGGERRASRRAWIETASDAVILHHPWPSSIDTAGEMR
jgi:hypothetical protein